MDKPDITLVALDRDEATALQELADMVGVSLQEVFAASLNLMKIAVLAQLDGHHLAILTPDDEIVRDITWNPGKPRA